MVVHREPEQDDEQERRQPRDDRAVRLEAEDRLGPRVLEDEHEHAVGRGNREQVEHDRLERHHDRAERDEQEEKREQEHEADHVRHPVPHLVREVDILGHLARHGRLDAGDSAERQRDELVAEDGDRMSARVVVAGPGERELDRGSGPGVVSVDREGRVSDPARLGQLLQLDRSQRAPGRVVEPGL